MILVVKASEHPSPPLLRSLSSVAKTIRRKESGMKRGGAQRVKESSRGRGDCAGSRGSQLEEGFAALLLFSLICIWLRREGRVLSFTPVLPRPTIMYPGTEIHHPPTTGLAAIAWGLIRAAVCCSTQPHSAYHRGGKPQNIYCYTRKRCFLINVLITLIVVTDKCCLQ